MSLISASIPNLINGVSQQPPSLRLKTQAELQENGLSTVVEGLRKRPASEHVAVLQNVPASIDSAFIHTIRRDENEFYTLVITSGALKVYDKDGAEQTVNSNPASAINYLSGLTDPATEVSATTIADYTFIVNKQKVVSKGTATTTSRPSEAMFYCKQGDYKTDFTIRVKYNGTTYSSTKQTQDSSNAANQGDVRTNKIIQDLNSGLSLPSGFTKERIDNVIYIKRNDGAAFDVEATDSRGDTFLFAFKGQVSDFKKLPPRGKEGFLIEVTGDNQKGQDDYYVQLQDPDGNGQLVWKEVAAPNILEGFDETTMPHQLIRKSNGTFTFKPADWDIREAGDDDTNPFPSFVDYKINDLFFHRNRLGMLADENVIMSEAGSYFNFFQNTVITFVDSGPIDVAVSNNQVSILKHAVPFSEQLLLFSDLTQFKLESDDILAPDTVSIDVTTQFEASLRSKPVGAGKYIFFPTKRGKWSGMREYFVDSDTDTNDAADITSHVPSYIEGEVTKLSASSNEDTLLLLTADKPNSIYVYRYYWNNTEKLQSSWSEWKFDGTVLNVDFNKSEIFMVIKRGTDVCLEKINLSTDTAREDMEADHAVLMDRRVRIVSNDTDYITYNSGTQTHTITYPFTLPSDVQFVDTKGELLTQAEAETYLKKGNLESNPEDYIVYLGTPYTFKYRFSEQVIKQDNSPVTIGRLQLRNWNIVYNDSGFFKTIVTPNKRQQSTKVFTGRNLGSQNNVIGTVSIDSGTFSFPVLSKATEVTVDLESDSFLPCIFQSAEWEGFYTMRSRRM
jgi:hypothetical protein